MSILQLETEITNVIQNLDNEKGFDQAMHTLVDRCDSLRPGTREQLAGTTFQQKLNVIQKVLHFAGVSVDLIRRLTNKKPNNLSL